MSCSFKFCRGGGTCFLEGVSPCSAHSAGTSDEAEEMARRMRRMGLSRSGFVESVAPDQAGLAETLSRMAAS